MSYLHALGRHAVKTLAPSTGTLGALVALPRGKKAEDYGLEPFRPRIARLRGPQAKIEEFGFQHPELRVELAPPVRPFMDRAGVAVFADLARRERGVDGTGVMVGVADTGLDVSNPEMVDERGRSRVAWMLDLSLNPLGVYDDLEKRFGFADAVGGGYRGAVLSNDMITELISDLRTGKCVEDGRKKCAPSDEVGHGTHVTGIASGRGATGKYPGIAPKADIIAVRLTKPNSFAIDNESLQRGVEFIFDRADAEKRPVVANLSLGADFGPHDGTTLWEEAIASFVGPEHPGRVVVAAAGNAGDIASMPYHQSVRVTSGTRMRVPIRTSGVESGSVQIWVTMRPGAEIAVGLDGPGGEEWIAPVERGRQGAKNTDDYNSGVIYAPSLPGSDIPPASNSAVVVFSGKLPAGTYAITLDGSGMAELYLEGLGDASLGADGQALFTNGVREGTISLPATHPSVLAVGCTVNRPRWTSIAGQELGLRVPILDEAGGIPLSRLLADGANTSREPLDGEICWFSSAGPTLRGVPKPEIAAPGALVVSALSRTAKPGSPGSVFTAAACPPTKSGKADNRCLQIDDTHGIANGTSMSAPIVSGVVALLLQRDPTLTQDKVLALLQGGAHKLRVDPLFNDQAGPGEVDAVGALDALEQMRNPVLHLPAIEKSWATLSADYVAADGSTPLTTILELRTADGQHRADFFDAPRLRPVVLVDDQLIEVLPELVRRGPGVWFFAWTPPPGLGGSRATFGATFDGVPIVATKTVPIASDRWNAKYPSRASGGSACTTAAAPAPIGSTNALPVAGLALAGAALGRRITRRRS
ncbi:MAG: S8 family serine peptidase [Deltaproteobacteria bacterium]|nr:S8 family serine peptidase [Deltaproteobacteria bacterium]